MVRGTKRLRFCGPVDLVYIKGYNIPTILIVTNHSLNQEYENEWKFSMKLIQTTVDIQISHDIMGIFNFKVDSLITCLEINVKKFNYY